jgi:hypothetical protein
MQLRRRQLLSLATRAASAMILSACGSVPEIRPLQPTSTSDPRPSASPAPAPTEERSVPSPTIPVPTGTIPARPTVGAAPASTPRPNPGTPTAQADIAIDLSVGAIPPTYFGMHIHQAATTTPWPAIPFGAWRLWDAGVTWPDLESRTSNWDFTLLDQYVALAQKHNVALLLPLGLTPTWASARPGEPSEHFQPGNLAAPKYIEDWRIYVSTVARRYKGRIRNYEIWNEPNLKEYWTGTTKELITLAHEASQILRDIDPTVTIVGPSATDRETGPGWLDDYLSAGGGMYLDAIAHHLYVFPSPPEALLPFAGRVRQVMAKHGMADKPLWNSELGWALPKVFSSDMEAAGYLARAYLLNWIGGVQRCYWYAWDNQEWATLWLTETDSRTLKPAAIAYREIENWLIGARIVSYLVDSANTSVCLLTRGDNYTARIVWNPDGDRTYLAPPAWQIKHLRDLTGARRDLSAGTSVQIGPVPILLEQ